MNNELKYDIQDVVRNTLKEFFYQVPEIEISKLGDNYIVKFALSPMDTKTFTASKMKKALSQFGKVSQSRFSHSKLTSGNTEFRYDIIPTIEENVHMTLQDYIIEALQTENEKTTLKYKNGLRIEAGNDIISLNKRDRAYMIYRTNKDTLKIYKPLRYQSLDGVKNFMLRTYNIELI